MPLNVHCSAYEASNRSRQKPYYSSTTTAVRAIFIALERFGRIASNMRFAMLVPRNKIHKKGSRAGTQKRFARMGPSKLSISFLERGELAPEVLAPILVHVYGHQRLLCHL